MALEEESGKATNGLGFAVVDRGPRELLEIATPDQIERYVRPIANGEYREVGPSPWYSSLFAGTINPMRKRLTM